MAHAVSLVPKKIRYYWAIYQQILKEKFTGTRKRSLIINENKSIFLSSDLSWRLNKLAYYWTVKTSTSRILLTKTDRSSPTIVRLGSMIEKLFDLTKLVSLWQHICKLPRCDMRHQSSCFSKLGISTRIRQESIVIVASIQCDYCIRPSACRTLTMHRLLGSLES